MVYENAYGMEGENARLSSVNFTAQSRKVKVEFSYFLRQSSYHDLVLSVLKLDSAGDTKEELAIWGSRYLRRGEDNIWQYGCASFDDDQSVGCKLFSSFYYGIHWQQSRTPAIK